MKELKSLIKEFKANQKKQEALSLKLQKHLNNPNLSFEQRLTLWEESPRPLKKHYPKLPSCRNKKIMQVFDRIRDRLNHAGPKIELSTGLMDDLYIYHHDAFEEAFDSESHLKTKQEFKAFMEYVFKHNIGSFN